MFRPNYQVAIRPTSKFSLQMLCLMGSYLVHIRKNIKLLIQFSYNILGRYCGVVLKTIVSELIK